MPVVYTDTGHGIKAELNSKIVGWVLRTVEHKWTFSVTGSTDRF